MKLWHSILLLGICFHHWTSADDAMDSDYGSDSEEDEIESINGINTVSDGSGKTLVSIEIKNEEITMDLSNRNFEAIRDHALDTLTNITVLDLSKNKIEKFQAGLFSKLNNLKELSLATGCSGRHRLPLQLTRNVFHGLSNLESLDLSGYNLPELRAGYFAGLPKFVNITVDSGTLKSLSTAVFKNHSDPAPTMEVPREILRRPMDSANIVRYRACMTDGILESVEETPELDNCTHSIQPFVSNGILEFSGRGIKGFRKNWFQIKMPNFNKISFSYHGIFDITPELINDLPSNIVEMKFYQNNIRKINNGIVNHNLRILTFYNTGIETIEDGAFAKLNLTELSVMFNRLNSTEFIRTLPATLEKFYFHGSSATEIISGTFSHLKKLKELSIVNHKLENLPVGLFNGLENLSILAFSVNNLNTIRKGTFANMSIDELNLYKNNISSIETGAFDGARIVKINLAGNSLKELKIELFNGILGSQLRELMMERNKLRNLEVGVFRGLENLELINLSDNEITEIQPDTFRGLSLLKLDLSLNKLEIIRRGTYSNMSINELNLRNNKISSIEAGAFDGAHIVELDLSWNLLKEFKEETLRGISGVKQFSLEHNPLETIEKGSMLNLREAKYVNLESTRITALENGTLFGLSTDDVDVIVKETPITLIQGGVFDKEPEN